MTDKLSFNNLTILHVSTIECYYDVSISSTFPTCLLPSLAQLGSQLW